MTCGDAGITFRTRVRRGSKRGGMNCEGSNREEKQCPEVPPCGSWSQWGKFSKCSVTCGSGTNERKRTCVNGVVGQPGCIGDDSETQTCSAGICPAVWGQWSDWGECDATCKQTRSRTCNGGNPGSGGCTGDATETRDCTSCPSSSDASCDGKFDDFAYCLSMNPTSCFINNINLSCQKRCCNELKTLPCQNDPSWTQYCVEDYRGYCSDASTIGQQFQQACPVFCGGCTP